MKKIVLIVPDNVIRSTGSGKHPTKFSKLEVTTENILKVLSKRTDYHQDYYFDSPENIKIVEIDDYKE